MRQDLLARVRLGDTTCIHSSCGRRGPRGRRGRPRRGQGTIGRLATRPRAVGWVVMGEGWAIPGQSSEPVRLGDVTLVEGRSFCVSDRGGDMEVVATHGMIVNGTRFVHHLVLRVDGDVLQFLGVQAIVPARGHLRHPAQHPHAGLADSTLLVVRNRSSVTGSSRTSRSRTSAAGRSSSR